MPGFINSSCSGKAIVLVDGVDELPASQRDVIRDWLKDLVDTFPDSRYVVTSRSGAAGPEWLADEGFASLELQPMNPSDIKLFIYQWHTAIKSQLADRDEISRVDSYASGLLEKLNSRRYLFLLAETPLLCALLCALHYDRKAHLPHNRMELYEVALEMLLERRDAEQNVIAEITLSRTQKTLLLQDIAYWLVRNGRSEIDKNWVKERIQSKLPAMSISTSAVLVYRNLLERSGLLREPVVDQVDFVHRSFQEYLAALEALAQDDTGLLVDNAHLDQWREVVIMAAGRAYAAQRETLLMGLIARGDSVSQLSDQLYLLAVACLETSPELSPAIRQVIRGRVINLLPPSNITIAKSFAAAGEFAADLLAQAQATGARETASTIRAAAQIGGSSGFEIIRKYRQDNRKTVQAELVRAWSSFDVNNYALEILAANSVSKLGLSVVDADLMSPLVHFPDLRRLIIDCHGEIDLSVLAGMSKLRFLWLQAQARMPKGLDALASLKSLMTLDLAHVPLSSIDSLAGLTKLETMMLASCTLDDISALAQLTNLVKLDLSRNKISDLSSLRDMTKLTDLNLNATAVMDLEPLAGLTAMTHLYCDNTHVSDMSPLASMAELSNLSMNSTDVCRPFSVVCSFSLGRLSLKNSKANDLSPLARLAALHISSYPEPLSAISAHYHRPEIFAD